MFDLVCAYHVCACLGVSAAVCMLWQQTASFYYLPRQGVLGLTKAWRHRAAVLE